jgi:hypothetical protein
MYIQIKKEIQVKSKLFNALIIAGLAVSCMAGSAAQATGVVNVAIPTMEDFYYKKNLTSIPETWFKSTYDVPTGTDSYDPTNQLQYKISTEEIAVSYYKFDVQEIINNFNDPTLKLKKGVDLKITPKKGLNNNTNIDNSTDPIIGSGTIKVHTYAGNAGATNTIAAGVDPTPLLPTSGVLASEYFNSSNFSLNIPVIFSSLFADKTAFTNALVDSHYIYLMFDGTNDTGIKNFYINSYSNITDNLAGQNTNVATLTAEFAPIPEPASMLLTLTGIGGFIAKRRFRKEA